MQHVPCSVPGDQQVEPAGALTEAQGEGKPAEAEADAESEEEEEADADEELDVEVPCKELQVRLELAGGVPERLPGQGFDARAH